MKKIIFGIFAHPDDEAFGPCGTLLKEVKDGAELHLITVTYGGAGENPDNFPDLASAREKEWRRAGAKIGATGLHGLSYSDGHLDNIAMLSIVSEIEPLIRNRLKDVDGSVEAEIMTFDSNGLTGHIDHIVASRAASFLYYRLKDAGLPFTRIRYYCNSEEKQPSHDISWIYRDKGRSKDEVNEIVDARGLRDEITAVMREHNTQRSDCEHYLASQGNDLGLDHFIVKS